MASVEAAINLVVRGQQRVDRLLQSLDQLERAVAGISNEPIQFDVAAPGRELDALVTRITNANQTINTSLQQSFQRTERSISRPFQTYLRNQEELNRLEERGATNTRAYEQALGRWSRAIDAVTAAQERHTREAERAGTEIARNNEQLEEGTRRLQAQARALRIIDNLADSWNDATVAISRFNGELEDIPQNLSSGQIRSEIRLFDQLASSVNTNSEAFRKFVIASQSAGQELGDVARRRIGILAEAFSAAPEARVTPGRTLSSQEVSRTRQEVERLLQLSSGRELVRSEAGLSLMIDQLQQIKTLIPFVDANYARLTQRINELNEELSRGTGPTQGAMNAELLRLADIQDRINNARLTSAQRTAVQNRYDTARAELDARGVRASREQTVGLVRQINAMQSLNREQERRNILIDDELSKVAGRASRVGLSDIPQALKDQLLSRADTAVDLLGQGELEQARRVRQELERDRIQFEKSHRNKLNLEEERSSQVSRLVSLEKELNKIRLSGRDVTAQMADLDLIRSEVADAAIQPNKQLLSDSSIILDRVADYITGQTESIRLAKENAKSTDRQKKANEDLTTITNNLKTIQGRYNELKKQGVSFGAEEAELQAQISQIETGRFVANKQNMDQLSRRVREFQSFQNLRVQEAVSTGAFTGTTQTPEKLEKERNRQLREAYGLRKTLDDLEKKGIASDLTRVDLLQQINTLEQRRGQIAADNLIAVQAELETTGRVLDVTRTEIARLKSDIEETSKATGFGKSFQDFQEALKGSRTFFGTESPAEAIDKIVREFNKDVQRAAVADAAPVQTAIRTEYEQMLDSFRNQFANLTTNPRFFGRLLSQIPDDALTASMAGAATDIATRGRTTTGVLTGIGKIPGGLESQIESAYQDAFGRVPGGVTRLFDKIASVFDALVGRRFSGAGLGGSGGGVRPPNGPGGGAGGAGGPGDFGNRLADAEAKGIGALLGLQELQKPSEVTTVRLEILSGVLKDLYNQLDPTSEDAKRFNSALRRTTARLDDIVASRAPDADPLVRLTRSPRLAQGISEGLIGGAFPLLFGQGAGAAVGGGLGGFAGGFMGGALGFGLSLIGTAVGTAVDTFVNNMKELGKSLRDPTAALTAMETAGLRVTPQLQDTVERLQSLGLAAAAQAVVFSELEAQLGKDGAAQIRALTEEQKKLDEQIQKLNGTMISALLPAVTGTVSVINDLTSAIKSLGEVQLPDWFRARVGRVAQFGTEAGLSAASFTNPGFGFGRFLLQQAGGRGRRAAEEASQAPVGLTPEQQRQQQLALPRATLEALNVQLDNGAKQFTDQVRAAAREQQDLDLQRRDLIESYERSIGDLRLTIERQVTQERLANAGRENEILATQGEVRLQQLRNANAELTRSLSGNEFGQQLADAVSQFTEQQLSTENEIANRRRNLELELETKRIQTEQYRADIAKQIEQLNLSTAKQVASIQLSVARKSEDYDRKRFQLEKQIAVMNLNASRIETEQKIAGLDLQVQAITDPALRQSVFNTIDKYRDIIKQRDSQIQKINAAQPPAPISFNVPALGASVSTSGIDKVVAKGAQLARQLESIRTQLNTLVSEGNFNEFNDRLKNLADQGVQALTNEYEDLLAAMSADPTAAADKRIVDATKAVTEGRGIQGSSLRKELIELVGLYGDLAKQNIELARTYEFLTSRLSSQLDQIEELKEQFNTLTVGNTEYEKTLIALTQRGVNPASEGFSKLIENAKEIDRLNQKIEVVNAFRTAATELTGSMRSLVEQFFELGSASEAVKRVSDELGKKAFGFILDIAFKPVEDAMQKTMFDLADRLGFDIKPESLKQLQEVTTIRQNVEIIANSIAPLVEKLKSLQPIVPGLTSGSASGGNLLTPSLPFSAQTSINSQDLINQINNEIGPRLFAKIDADIQGYYDKIISMHALNPPTAERRITDVDKLIQTRTNLLDGLAEAFSNLVSRLDTNTPGAPELVDALNKKINEMRLKYEKKAEDIFRGEVVAPTGPQSSLPLSMMNGIGGPDLPRQAFPLNSDVPYPDTDLPAPNSPILKKAEQDAANNIRPLNTEIQKTEAAIMQAIRPMAEFSELIKLSSVGVVEASTAFNASNIKFASIVPQWTKNLGAAVTGLGLASSAVVSIVGGIGSIKKGGAGNVLSGIGSILTTIGGIGMSAVNLGMFSGGGGSAFSNAPSGLFSRVSGGASPLPDFRMANGDVLDDGKLMRFANGGILQSPTLFSFEDAGVTKTGQAGEAGVEAVMPLKRTKDGRLGVEADLSIPFENDGQFEAEDGESGESAGTSQGPMVPFLRAGGRTGSMTATQMLQAAAEAGLSVPFMRDSTVAAPDLASLDSPIRFETFQVGQLDVVTREEAEEIGRRAEARGTIKGAALAQKKMQNSPATRRKSGLPI